MNKLANIKLNIRAISMAYSSDVSKTFKGCGVSVYVVVPENDFSKTKTIIGSVANKGQIEFLLLCIYRRLKRYEEA